MKKIVILTMSLMMLAGVLFGCTAPAKQPAATAEPAEATSTPAGLPGDAAEDAAVPVDSKIELYIKQKTVTTETEAVQLIIINGSDKTYSYDYVQKLERKNDDGSWEVVPLTNEAVSLALLVIAAGETQEQTFDFANHYEPLTRGTYRIVKTFVDENGGNVEVNCEFEAM